MTEKIEIVDRKVPWQGFQKIDGAATAEEAIQSALLDWNVSPQPLFCAGQMIEGRYGLVRDVDSKTLGFCGDWYSPSRIGRRLDSLKIWSARNFPLIRSEASTADKEFSSPRSSIIIETSTATILTSTYF